MSRPLPTLDLIDRLLEVIDVDILPLTTIGVAKGNKVFGAALLRKADLSLFLAESNNEQESPLWHAEMHLLKRYHELPETARLAPEELLFLSTHEPCSLCLSAITWAGFDNFFYLFSHEDSRDSFAIPHDLKILKEVFNVDPGEYRSKNAFWDSYHLKQLINDLPIEEKTARTDKIFELDQTYQNLSDLYQAGKDNNAIPLS